MRLGKFNFVQQKRGSNQSALGCRHYKVRQADPRAGATWKGEDEPNRGRELCGERRTLAEPLPGASQGEERMEDEPCAVASQRAGSL